MEITWSKYFTADVDYYRKKKKYTKINKDILSVVAELKVGNLIGDKLENLHLDEGTAAYKVRVANSSANVGKSNGFRIIYYLALKDEIYLLTIYSKKDDDRIPTDATIMMMIKNIIDG
ncbi:MAG: hypothetical protein IJ668_02260 [Selenomonadaceae bacterium]|nr:hypothetical protein [Selenomonadaceae bacterium]